MSSRMRCNILHGAALFRQLYSEHAEFLERTAVLGSVKDKPWRAREERVLDGPCARLWWDLWSGRKNGSAGVEPKNDPGGEIRL